MKKAGQSYIVFYVIILILVITFAVILFLEFSKEKSEESIDTAKNQTQKNQIPNNQTSNNRVLTNQTNNSLNATSNQSANNITNNQTINNTEQIIDNMYVPNPTGKVTYIDRENNGEYFCNTTEKPSHGIEVYTFRIINGTKTLSQKSIKTDIISTICDFYGNISNGMYYNIEWQWPEVKNIEGYRVYQYYKLNNISRDYDYSLDVKVNRILDTSLELWKKV
jgi:uncharacterized protein YpmB